MLTAAQAEALRPELVALRRDVHRQPEIGLDLPATVRTNSKMGMTKADTIKNSPPIPIPGMPAFISAPSRRRPAGGAGPPRSTMPGA